MWEHGFTPMLRAFGRIAAVSYTDDKSTRWTVGLIRYATIAYAGSDGHAGELTSLSAQASYPLFGKVVIFTGRLPPRVVPVEQGKHQGQRDRRDPRRAVRPTSAISFDVQGQWLTNKLMQRDLRVQARFSYWFADLVLTDECGGTALFYISHLLCRRRGGPGDRSCLSPAGADGMAREQ